MSKPHPLLTAVTAVSLSVGACAAPAPSDDVAQAESAATGRGPRSKHAIVLVHGFSGSTEQVNPWSFHGVLEKLTNEGYVAYAAKLSPYQSVPYRARELASEIDAARAKCGSVPGCDASKVHVIAHSQGGLDARYLTARLGYGDKVASIITVSTPHHGTPVADDVATALRALPVDEWVDFLASKFSVLFTDAKLAANSELLAALDSMSQDKAPTLNRAMPPVPGITYRAFAGVSFVAGLNNPLDPSARDACDGKFAFGDGARDAMGPSLWPTAAIAAGLSLRANDGVVTVESAKLPEGYPGKFMGCIPADHLDEVGHTLISLSGNDNPTGFDHLAFYSDVASKLDAWVTEDRNAN